MKSQAASILVLIASTISVSAAEVFTYQPELLVKPEPIAIAGRSMDVLGLPLGMPFADASSIIEKSLPGSEIRIPKNSFQISRLGVTIQTSEFANQVFVTRKDDQAASRERITLNFSGPASGNQLIGLERSLNYDNVLRAPLVSEVRKAVLAKYGNPSLAYEIGGSTMTWSFTGGVALKCTGNINCPPSPYDYFPQSLSDYANEQSTVDVVLKVSINGAYADPTKVGSLSVQYGSAVRRRIAAKADLQSLIHASEGAASRTSKQVAGPAL